jgi:hypothetical protein
MWQGRPGRAAQAARQKRNTVDQQGLALTYALAAKGPDDLFSLVLNAQQGNRNEANRLAEAIDQRPFGYATLMQAIYYCTCGAPFDLEAVPEFASLLSASGLQWPPARPIEFPLKDW